MITGGARARVDGDRPVVLDRPDGLRGNDDRGLFASLEPLLFLVDGNNMLWRAAHGSPAPFTAKDGRDITPLFRFFTQLRRTLGTYGLFSECIVCFDGAEGWTGRIGIDAAYKSNRCYDTNDVSFMEWLPEIRAALESAGVACVEHPRHEADDVIATLAARTGARRVRILSTDRDYYQLLGPTVDVVDPRSRPQLVDADVVQRYGVTAAQWCDFRALAGDPADGIPGLRGVGPKRAASMLASGLRVEDMDAPERDDVLRWRELIRLRTDVPLEHVPTGRATPPLPSAVAVCRELGLVQ